jgi:hypothetical protein
MDGVDQACDTCLNQANAPVAPSAGRTLVSGQRDDDGDGRGNRCDFDYDNAGAVISAIDFNEMKSSVGGLVSSATCGLGGTLACAPFDHDEAGAAIAAADFNLTKAAVGKIIADAFPTCPACARPYSCALDDPDAPETFGRPVCVGPNCVEAGQPDPCAAPGP